MMGKNIKKREKLGFILLFIFLISILLIELILSIPEFDPFGTSSSLTEDQSPLFEYNFSNNVTINVSDPADDILTYSILGINSTLYPNETNTTAYPWFVLNGSGILTINSTLDNHTGRFNLSVQVLNQDLFGESRPFYFIVNATNDAPDFTQIQNEYNLTQYQTFFQYINATDEASEDHYPLYFNITFLNGTCTHASWSDRSNCTLLNFVNFTNTSAMMNFTPVKDDVGIYYANVSVMDYGENYACTSGYCEANYSENRTTYYSQTVTFNVFSILEINASNCSNFVFYEGSPGVCYINITTKGESDLINISSYAILRNYVGSVPNTSWFYGLNQTNASNFTQIVYINVTPGKTEIGNWTINFSVFDLDFDENVTEQIYAYVNRTSNDVPELDDIPNQETSIEYHTTINFSAYDDDFLIPDKNENFGGFNETSNFTVIILNQSDLGEELDIDEFNVTILEMPVVGTNQTTAEIQFIANSSDAGNYTINVSVNDKENSFSFKLFNLTILYNTPPQWDENFTTIFVSYEGNNTFLNLSLNVTDPDNDTITFSFENDSQFDSFNLTSDGIINFSSIDVDVGFHNITIIVSDGYLMNTTYLNFTIYNVNDDPVIQTPLSVSNATVDANSNINTTQDDVTTIYLWIEDEDFKIPSGQSSFYSENLTINLTIEGNNTNLFSFVENTAFPVNGSNLSQFYATFTPSDTDVGSYNIIILVTDNNGSNTSINFNLTVFDKEYSPVLTNLANQSSAINRTLYYQIIATDVEDGNSSASNNFTFTYSFLNGSDFINNNESIFNTTNGELNFTFNSSHEGVYRINITVNDTASQEGYGTFWIFVYGFPLISYPNLSYTFNLVENGSYSFNFTANHTVGDNLTYEFYVGSLNGSDLKNRTDYYGNGSNFTWYYTPNFTDETYGVVNLTMVVYPANANLANASFFNDSRIWNISINHTDHPIEFLTNISDIQATSPHTLTLSDHFFDADAADPWYNQTVTFSSTLLNSSGGVISIAVVSWVNGTTPSITFSTNESSNATYTITAYEYNLSNSSQIVNNVTSNNFSVILNISYQPDPDPDPDPDTGGTSGGGGSMPVAFKLITPGYISGYTNREIQVPITITNTGFDSFSGISLGVVAYKNGSLDEEVRASLDLDYIALLKSRESRNLTLTLFFAAGKAGNYEVTLNASSQKPKYTDWAKIYVSLIETNETEDIGTLVVFTEEFIVENPECAEITEIVKEARDYFDKGDLVMARQKAEEAINACKKSISQRSLLKRGFRRPYGLNEYLVIATVIALILGLGYYFFKRRKFGKARVKPELKAKEDFAEGIH